jgi:GH15 family glucan-1,4-alpha-glucosidase
MGAFIPYPAIERHGIIGDRRTAALVACDGTIDWMCVPHYDGRPLFGALLDAKLGGYWRAGPAALRAGVQTYDGDLPVLRTRWTDADCDLELFDLMPMPPEGSVDGTGTSIILRRLRCVRGSADCVVDFHPADDYRTLEDPGALPDIGCLTFWTSRDDVSRHARICLSAGEELWMAMSAGADVRWSVDRVKQMCLDARAFWTDAMARLDGIRRHPRLTRSAMIIRLLEFARSGSIVAAPTTSLPERIGGAWNADYRLTWVRDASLSMAALARLGDIESAGRYLGWLTERTNVVDDSPLQVLYSIGGDPCPRQHERRELSGYRDSRPVRRGNHAFRQRQLDIYGYLADCALVYLEHGGEWRPEFWDLLCRCADYVSENWQQKGHGIWELDEECRYLSGRVMCWTALDRVLRIDERTHAHVPHADRWRAAADAIRQEVEYDGWSDRLGAFKQAIERDTLDASALLIPLTGLLPLEHPRVAATVTAIAERLTIDGCVYRFDPAATELSGPHVMGQFEAAFLPCTFWLASVCALAGRSRDAEDILAAVDRVSGPLGLYAEGIDPRGAAFAGNFPLLFSHVEHIRAVQTLEGQPWYPKKGRAA